MDSPGVFGGARSFNGTQDPFQEDSHIGRSMVDDVLLWAMILTLCYWTSSRVPVLSSYIPVPFVIPVWSPLKISLARPPRFDCD